MKYKKGDKAIVRPDLNTDTVYYMDGHDYRNDATEHMLALRGKVVTITEALSYGYHIKECFAYTWTDDMFIEAAKPIVIYQNGVSVFALDKNTGEKAEARCCPGDTFDFCIGAELAFKRLKNLTRTPACPFKVGDLVIGKPEASGRYRITEEGWIGLVKHIDSDGIISVLGRGYRSESVVFWDLEPQYFRKVTEADCVSLDQLKWLYENIKL